MPKNRFVCTAIIFTVSLVFVAGGILWYLEILNEPIGTVHVFPGILILFGIGFAFIGLKAAASHYQCERKDQRSQDKERVP